MQAGISIKNIIKSFGKNRAVDSVSLDIAPGSFTTLLGPSGCGKTTLLRIIAGLEEAEAGSIIVRGKVIFDKSKEIDVPARKRGIGLVFQSYALWPHMTVFDNIAYGLKVINTQKSVIGEKVLKVLKTVEMEGFEERYPSELSGGQQQRISMARMLVTEPLILLMDEPLSNLDAKLRLSMRAELKRIHKEVGLTVVYVTHDQTEAMTLSTKIAVMKNGTVQQYDTPNNVYRKPKNFFVSDFMGNPTTNAIDGVVGTEDGKNIIRVFDTIDIIIKEPINTELAKNNKVVIAIKPEDIELSSQKKAGFVQFQVRTVLDSGPDRYVFLRSKFGDIVARDSAKASSESDESVYVKILPNLVNIFDKETGISIL